MYQVVTIWGGVFLAGKDVESAVGVSCFVNVYGGFGLVHYFQGFGDIFQAGDFEECAAVWALEPSVCGGGMEQSGSAA